MRDIVTIPFYGDYSLLIASDNSGSIGMKAHDLVHAPYETVAYYSFRVAAMECIAAGGEPISVVLHNFCGNEPWDKLVKGIHKGLLELKLRDVSITGSSESNFSLQQSAVGLLVLGKKITGKTTEISYNPKLKYGIVGLPLVGEEVLKHQNLIAPLAIFQDICCLKDVMVWPVGSKGILYEMNQMYHQKAFIKEKFITNVDIVKSSGPATCFIAVYHESQEVELKKLAGDYFHSMDILS
jgi:hypothetical protein